MIEQISLAHTYGGAHIDNLLEEMLLGGAVPYNNQVSAIWLISSRRSLKIVGNFRLHLLWTTGKQLLWTSWWRSSRL